MTSTAITTQGPSIGLPFWKTTAGKKTLLAASGAVLAGFVIVHLLGNLQIFMGPNQFNGYARALRSLPAIVWGVRILLLVMMVVHIWTWTQLAILRTRARPQNYIKHQFVGSSFASRSMYISGPILAAFIVYHLLQFTFGAGGTPYKPDDAYGNVIAGFRSIPVSVFYILAMAMLCLHLRHGVWSVLQTLGFHHPGRTPKIKTAVALLAILIFLGFISIPLAVLMRAIPRGS